MAGKVVAYEAHLKDLRKREVPELNDEFRQGHGRLQDLAALKSFVRSKLDEAAEQDANVRAQSTILDLLLEAATFEGPASMTALQLDDFCQELMAEIKQRASIQQGQLERLPAEPLARRRARRALGLLAPGHRQRGEPPGERRGAGSGDQAPHGRAPGAAALRAFRAEMERRGSTTRSRAACAPTRFSNA